MLIFSAGVFYKSMVKFRLKLGMFHHVMWGYKRNWVTSRKRCLALAASWVEPEPEVNHLVTVFSHVLALDPPCYRIQLIGTLVFLFFKRNMVEFLFFFETKPTVSKGFWNAGKIPNGFCRCFKLDMLANQLHVILVSQQGFGALGGQKVIVVLGARKSW